MLLAMADVQHSAATPSDIVLDEMRVRETLVTIFDCVLPAAPDVEYRFGGTASVLFRGIALPAGDIDFLLQQRRDVDLFSRGVSALSSTRCLMPPTWLPDDSQYFARYVVDNVVVEFTTVELQEELETDTFECVGRGPWEHFDLISCGPYRVPTVALELRLLSELRRNRPERYRPILETLRRQRCDVALVRRGFVARSIPEALQRETLKYIEPAPSSSDLLSPTPVPVVPCLANPAS